MSNIEEKHPLVMLNRAVEEFKQSLYKRKDKKLIDEAEVLAINGAFTQIKELKEFAEFLVGAKR